MRVTKQQPPPPLLACAAMTGHVPPHPPSCSLTTLPPEAKLIHSTHGPCPSPTCSLYSLAAPMLQQSGDHNGVGRDPSPPSHSSLGHLCSLPSFSPRLPCNSALNAPSTTSLCAQS
jgi:hypothetical protein